MTLPASISASVIDRLKSAVGAGGWTDDPDLLAPFLVEWRDTWRGTTPLMLSPATTAEASAVLAICHANRIAVTTQGGNTGLVGGQIPQGEVLISTRRMKAIRSIDPLDDSIIAEAGCILTDVHAAAATVNKRFPLVLASQGSATIGGLISTNAGGVHVRRHGMMRALVLGLEAVLPDGSVFSELTSLRKDNTGYDLKQLLIGAEGTLGLVTAASLKLVPVPRAMVVSMLAVESAKIAVELLHRLEERTGAVAAFELINHTGVAMALKNLSNVKDPLAHTKAPWRVLVEFESSADGLGDLAEEALGEAIEAGLVIDCLISQNEAQAQDFWLLREEMSAAQRPEGASAKHDISVPVSQIPAFLERADAVVESIVPGCQIVSFGHASDGNIHYDVVQPPGMEPAAFKARAPTLIEAVHDVAVSLHGSISAEHGIGISRREEFIRREPSAHLKLMHAIKSGIDPHGIMNPRVLI
jgi:FAD/FMN-containing dehydrogenase